MSYQMRTLSSNPLARDRRGGQHAEDEAEYDRLRGLARSEQNRRHELIGQSKQAYQSGDGARAKQLSNQAKEHEAAADRYNKQASEYIFRVNNANQEENTIDLHGLFVEEAEEILAMRIQAAKRQHVKGIHVIVGKGIHSENHIQKIKPAVERFCHENNLAFSIEKNAGRIYIDLEGEGGEVEWGNSGYQPHPQPHHAPQHQGGGGGDGGGQQGEASGGLLNLLFGCIKKLLC